MFGYIAVVKNVKLKITLFTDLIVHFALLKSKTSYLGIMAIIAEYFTDELSIQLCYILFLVVHLERTLASMSESID